MRKVVPNKKPLSPKVHRLVTSLQEAESDGLSGFAICHLLKVGCCHQYIKQAVKAGYQIANRKKNINYRGGGSDTYHVYFLVEKNSGGDDEE